MDLGIVKYNEWTERVVVHYLSLEIDDGTEANREKQ